MFIRPGDAGGPENLDQASAKVPMGMTWARAEILMGESSASSWLAGTRAAQGNTSSRGLGVCEDNNVWATKGGQRAH